MPLGQSLQVHRLKKGLTQPELARLTGIAQANLSNIEKDKKDLNFFTLKKICFALDVPVWEIVKEAERVSEGLVLTRADIENLAKAILGDDAKRPLKVNPVLVKALRRVFSIERGISDKALARKNGGSAGFFSAGTKRKKQPFSRLQITRFFYLAQKIRF